MCGIVGYVGGRPCLDLLVAGLEKLEYRGYDSAGVSVIEDGPVERGGAGGNPVNPRGAVEGGGARSATLPTCGRQWRSGTSAAVASRSPRPRPRPASPTPGGRPTGGSPRR